MAHLGNSPGLAARTDFQYTATAGQTSFTGATVSGLIMTIQNTNVVDVIVNGIVLLRSDVGSITGSTVTLVDPRSAGDNVVIRAYGSHSQVINYNDDRRVGEIATFYGTDSTPLPGFLLCNGAAVTSTYPELRAHLLALGALTDVSGNPYLPNLGGQFLRGWLPGQVVDSGRVFGSTQTDSLKDHTHILQYTNAGGAATTTWSRGNAENSGLYSTTGTVSSPNNAGTETRPTNVTVTYWIKAYSVAQTDAGSIDLGQLTADFSSLGVRTTALEGGETAVTLSGTSYDITGIPSGMNRIEIIGDITWSGTVFGTLLAGYSSGFGGTTYASSATTISTSTIASTASTSAVLLIGNAAAVNITPIVTLERKTGNQWLVKGHGVLGTSGASVLISSMLNTAGTLDRLRFAVSSGTITGTVTVRWSKV